MRQALQGSTPQEVEFRWKCKRGDLRWVSGAIFPIFDQAKKVEGAQIVLQDITTRKEAEEARGQAERALEEHRTMTVRTNRLRFLGQMAAGMAHELNQPLQGVRGQTEHLLIGMERGWRVQKAQLREKLQLIITQADRMAHIIEHLRVFAREAGRPTQRLVQVGEVVRAAVSLLEAQFRSRGVEMAFDLGTTPLLVSANPFSLEEVILNLLTNARDAVEERGQTGLVPLPPQIMVRAWAEGAGAEPRVRIEVLDQGAGIPETILDQIFDPFFTTKSPDRGTGLGLSISKALVEEVGGSLAIQSTVGQGTQVSLSLPAASPPRAP
jgi:C4-dicarboxylate-specific signal transduction histidine kinase